MRDPLQSYDVELLKRYEAERQQLESLPPATIELSANQALAIVIHVQFSAADPAVKYKPLLQSAITAAKHIQELFNRESAIYEVLELGWAEPETDESVPPQLFTSTPCRPKKVRRPPPYFPDDDHHF